MSRIAEALGVSRSNLIERANGATKSRGPYFKSADEALLPLIRRFVAETRSNRRWCSDGLEFTCWNGEIVRFAFIIDAFDREIIARVAVTGTGIDGSDIRDMTLEAVERRFGGVRAPNSVEHLSDNGSPYIARETREFAIALNLVPCFTPVRSPQSNGMAEAFVKTFKRDYVRVNPLPDAEAVMRRIPVWIADYNAVHPHSALGMRSQWEFIRTSST